MVVDLKSDKVQKELLKIALLNATKYKGKANPGTVISGALGFFPTLKSDMKNLALEAKTIVDKVNNMSIDDQTTLLLSLDPKALEKKEHDLFGFLKIKDQSKITTCFPPGPEKHPHIGHAKAILINYELAKKYNGKFILRFDDTNPDLVKEEFYNIMLNDFKWLGVNPDQVIYASDYMDLYYKHTEELIKSNKAYVCFEKPEEFKIHREKGTKPKAYSHSPEENLKLWQDMKNYKPGECVVRLKIDITHQNSTMRDPTIFRIITSEHARQSDKYTIWPTYDFQTAIMDGYLNITHRLRSKEFELRNELQRYIQKQLNYKITNIYEFARFNIKDAITSGRQIRELISKKELIGWDDPSLLTLSALRKRGFLPEAIKSFVLNTGITKNESTLTLNDLILHNRKLLEKSARKYFFVEDPVKITIKNCPNESIYLSSQTLEQDKKREFALTGTFFIPKKDYNSLKPGVYRLIECLNFKYTGQEFIYLNKDIETFKEKGIAMFHFTIDDTKAKILMPDKKIIEGFVEPSALSTANGKVIHFERFGYVCKNNDTFWFTHK